MKRILVVGLAASLAFASLAFSADNMAKAKKVYDAKCAVCHASGVAGAPKLGDKDTWKPRIAKGMDKLYLTAQKGVGAMPPMGGCKTCTGGAVNAAVDYMVENSK